MQTLTRTSVRKAPDEASYESPSAPRKLPLFAVSADFLREHWLRFLAVSAIVLVPCFWHRRIVAGDLGSHIYNAWLVRLIDRGQAPGLWISHQWTNVLFDLLLSWSGALLGWDAGEKIAVSIAVLIFFWGVFAFVCAATRQAPWLIVPCIALATYGYTFCMGFFDYYLAIGLAFLSLAIFWRGTPWERIVAAAVAPLVLLAHPVGLIWLFGAAIYIGVASAVHWRWQPALFGAGIAALFAGHHYFWTHFEVERAPHSLFWFNGADQLILFGNRYWIPAVALLVFAAAAIAADLVQRRGARSEHRLLDLYGIPLQLYILALLAVPLLPRGIHFSEGTAPIALLTERLTSVSLVLICCLLGAMRPRKWHVYTSCAVAAVFFVFLYQDTASVNRMEAQAERLVRTIPAGQRVLATIEAPPDSRILIQHMVDRACVGYCFSYGNYEPSSNVFRVRATPGNRYVLPDYGDAVDTESGEYVVQPDDLPAYQVYQCSASGTDLCMRPLQAGEPNDRLGVHPDDK
jgi:hypothetical protein